MDLWKLLWDFDPNGLLVLDSGLAVKVVNPALCRMLRFEPGELVGRPAARLLGDVSDFRRALDESCEVVSDEVWYPRFALAVRKVVFPVPSEGLVAGIFVDVTRERSHREELEALRRKAALEVRSVVDEQMRVTQEIAGLLGERTAETKVSLLRLLALLGPDGG